MNRVQRYTMCKYQPLVEHIKKKALDNPSEQLYINLMHYIDKLEDDDMKEIQIKKLNDNAIMPTRAHELDSGLDLYVSETTTIKGGETKVIPTGIAVNLPEGTEAQVRPRSGKTLKTKLRVALGTIDQTYHKEVGIITDNIGIENITVEKGERLAQLVVVPISYPTPREVESFEYESDRGAYGSTGE